MLPVTSYEMIRQMNEERRERSLKRFWWRHVIPVGAPAIPTSSREADVIELVLGAQCDEPETIGA